MNMPAPQVPTAAWSIYRAIVGIGALCALLIVTVYQTTADRIRENQERFLAQAISQVLPAAQFTVAVELGDDGRLVETAEVFSLPVLLGYDENNELIGAAVAAEGMASSGQPRGPTGFPRYDLLASILRFFN
ncbi:MAG: hypothetical protein IIA09_15175 [Proteobacteria bacterium]|nr:hypothetical protein [Pseudomonadota bacterium]